METKCQAWWPLTNDPFGGIDPRMVRHYCALDIWHVRWAEPDSDDLQAHECACGDTCSVGGAHDELVESEQ